MDRKGFFQRLFGLGAVAIIAPTVLAESDYIMGIDPIEDGSSGGYIIDRSMLPSEWSTEKIMEYWRMNGIFPIDSSKEYKHVGHIRWKGSRKVGKLTYFDNDGQEIIS